MWALTADATLVFCVALLKGANRGRNSKRECLVRHLGWVQLLRIEYGYIAVPAYKGSIAEAKGA
eukprot:1149334-Pelagomonas_calceolata.AAC.1